MVDLKGQHEFIKEEIKLEIDQVLNNTSFINGPVVYEFQKDLERFNQNINKDHKKRKILFVGRNEDRKGIKILIEAFKIINKKYSTVELNLVGEGVSLLTNEYKNIPNCKFYDHME